jgi:hypothetical protein
MDGRMWKPAAAQLQARTGLAWRLSVPEAPRIRCEGAKEHFGISVLSFRSCSLSGLAVEVDMVLILYWVIDTY